MLTVKDSAIISLRGPPWYKRKSTLSSLIGQNCRPEPHYNSYIQRATHVKTTRFSTSRTTSTHMLHMPTVGKKKSGSGTNARCTVEKQWLI